MHAELMLRKVVEPGLPPTILYREQLIATLQNGIDQKSAARHKLTLLYAPAGYGKTTLLADFARHTDLPCCWYFLDQADIDRVTFLKYLIASIRQCFPHFGSELEALFSQVSTIPTDQQNAFYKAIVDMLCRTMASDVSERFVLIFCNFHEVNENEEFTTLINYFIQCMPSNCSLFIESRVIPNIEFAPLLLRHEISGLSRNALRFSAQEIQMLAQMQGFPALTSTEAEQLVASFDGWIAGIFLGTRLGGIHNLGSSGQQMNRKNLFMYLANEAFKHAPDNYAFLQKISIFPQIIPSVCDKLLDISDSAIHLQNLEKQELFITSSKQEEQTLYLCNPLVREILSEQLQQQCTTLFFNLHRRAATIWKDLQDYDQSMYHALAANAYDLVAQLIVVMYKDMLKQGYIDTLVGWIDKLPEETLQAYPKVLLIRATIYNIMGEAALTRPLLDRATAALDSYADGMGKCLLQAEIDILRSKLLFHAGDYLQAQTLCQQALTQVPETEIALRTEAHLRLGICANLLGDSTAGIIHLQKALRLCSPQTVDRLVADIHGSLGNTYSFLGNFPLAEHHLARALTCCEQLHDERGKISNLTRMALVKARQGKSEEAEEIYLQALNLSRGPMAFHVGEAYALMNLGDISLERGEYRQALTLTEDALRLAQSLKDTYLINSLFCNLIEIYFLMGDSISAMHLLSEMDKQTETTVSYEDVQRELTRALIQIWQGQYEEAFASLNAIEPALDKTNLIHKQIQARLRMITCQLARRQPCEVMRYAEAIVSVLTTYQGFKHLALKEVQRLPLLAQALQTQENLSALRIMLDMDGVGGGQESDAGEEPKPPVSQIIVNPAPRTAEMPRLTLLAFGKPVVLIDDKPVKNWRMARTRELCFLLLDAGGPLNKEEIINALWEDDVPDTIDQTFYLIIHYLRKNLGGACIISREQSYKLDLSMVYGNNIWYDVGLFLEQYKNAKQNIQIGDDIAAKEALLTMVKLYRGDYVESFYSNWCLARRDALRSTYIDARRLLAQIAWRQEQFEESAEHWQQVLSIDDYLEEVHYEVMRCYVRQGKRGLALRQYQRCEEALQREFGVQPGADIQALYQHINNS
ncbi:MAG TPA: tetratricopeptide repeat protein [Ktedonobacteraceae bacterium]|nr:tetratricopeptide repeat protein [Ktedonobacteraceae bacterium]